ncbi:MAG: hypothetical protein WD118_11640 [Phycisphaeraceae bacterium]
MKFAAVSLCLSACLAAALLGVQSPASDARAKGCEKPAHSKVYKRNRQAVIFNQTLKRKGHLDGIVLYGCAAGVGQLRSVWGCGQGGFTEYKLQSVSLRGVKATLEAELLTQENYNTGKLIHLTRTLNLRTGKRVYQRSQPRPEPAGLNYIYDCPADLSNDIPFP